MQVEARTKKEALAKAREELAEKGKENIDSNNFSVKLIKERKGWLGFGNKDNIYEVNYEQVEDVNEDDERFLEMASDSIQVDGDFEFKINEAGVFIRIISPKGKGDPLHYQTLKSALEKKGIVEIDWDVVQEAVHDAEEEWVEIAPRKPELDSDAEAEVEISKDKLRAFLNYISAQGGKKLFFEDLLQILHEAGVTYGIQKDKLRDIVKFNEEQHDVLVARGKEPVPPQDGQLIYHFEEKQESIGTKREDGSMDFYDLGLINNVQEGDLLVTGEAPQPGQPGKGVDGKEIEPEEPKDYQLPSGKNVVEKDGTLVAEITGQVVKDGNKVNVLPIHQINGNVDLSTGNIDFVGNVEVKGDITEGFEVKAEGNVEVKGNVSAGTIKSGGEVVVHKGFVGKDKGCIEAQGDVRIKFVENGTITTAGSIIVNDAIMHSQLNAGNKITVVEKKGLLVGGRCRAGQKIEANIIGSSLATTTRLEAGINPDLKKRMTELKEDLEEEQQNMLKTKKALGILKKIKQKKKLPRNKEKMYHNLLSTREKLQKSIEEQERELEELKEKAERLSQGRITVHSKIFPGTKIIIGSSQFNVREELRHSSFIEEEGEVRQLSL